MKKTNKKIATLLLSLVAFATFFVTTGITAQAKPVTSKKQIVYLQSTNSNSSSTQIEISGLSGTDIFDINSVTSSKPGVVSVESINTDGVTGETSVYSGIVYIEIKCNKAGTSVISYKINDKTYKTTVKVYKYTNAIKTLKITGVANGKNQASASKYNSYIVSYTLEKTIKKPVLTVAAKKNWKIKKIALTSYNSKFNPSSTSTTEYDYGVSKAKLYLSPLKAKNMATLTITMQNKKTKGTIVYTYTFNNAGQ